MRIFLAVEIPGHVKSRVFHDFENLQRKNLFIGKFTEKDNLHLTLKFFGEVTNEKLEEIIKKLKGINFKNFYCEVGKAGFFDNENHIRIIWVSLLSEKLNELQKKINNEFLGFPDNKRFSSHITLARVKSINKKQELTEAIKKIHFKKLNFPVEEFVLMKSELFPKGPRYKIIERFKLRN